MSRLKFGAGDQAGNQQMNQLFAAGPMPGLSCGAYFGIRVESHLYHAVMGMIALTLHSSNCQRLPTMMFRGEVTFARVASRIRVLQRSGKELWRVSLECFLDEPHYTQVRYVGLDAQSNSDEDDVGSKAVDSLNSNRVEWLLHFAKSAPEHRHISSGHGDFKRSPQRRDVFHVKHNRVQWPHRILEK